jgi:Methyltransferase domain
MAEPSAAPDPSTACRLCGADTRLAFSRTAADGVDIACYECTGCESLQTETPYWIAELYAKSSGASHQGLDTEAVERCLTGRIAVAMLWKAGGFSSQRNKLLDWGGGPGLLVRLLRDVGLNAFLYDKYSPNHYAVGFTARDDDRYDFVTAFEVFEHFPSPATDLVPLFATSPRCLLVSTAIFCGQGPDWTYLGAPKSEHVFFYSEKALRWIGERYGYEVFRLPHDLTLFFKRPFSSRRLRLVHALLSKPYIAQLVFALKHKWSRAADDNQLLRARRRESDAGRSP